MERLLWLLCKYIFWRCVDFWLCRRRNRVGRRNRYAMALYECDEGFTFPPESADRMFCSRNKWVGPTPVCLPKGPSIFFSFSDLRKAWARVILSWTEWSPASIFKTKKNGQLIFMSWCLIIMGCGGRSSKLLKSSLFQSVKSKDSRLWLFWDD